MTEMAPALARRADEVDLAEAGSRRWAPRRPRLEVVGVAMAVIVFLCAGAAFALQVPAFHGTDERAHLAYAHAVAAGDLPEIEDRPDIPAEATEWRAAVYGNSRGDSYRTIWVANHPPLHYMLVAPLVWLSEAAGRADGGLLLLRFANLAFAAVGVGLTYLLGVRLNGSRRLGLAAACLVAVLPRVHYEFAQALNDGMAFAATTAVLWAAVRYVRRGHSRADLALVSATVVVAAGARAAAMIIAVAVVGVLAVIRMATSGGSLPTRAAAAFTTAAVALAPAAILFGWFYWRNVNLYGDLGTSRYLMERFGRDPGGSLVEVATDWSMWVDIYQALPTRSLLSIPATAPGTLVAGVAAVAAVIGLLLVALPGRRRPRPVAADLSRPALAICVVAVLVVCATIAQHVAAGGLPSSRYTFPALGVLACLFVLGLAVSGRLLPLLAIATVTVWTGHVLPTRVASDIQRSDGPRPRALAAGVGPILGTLSFLATCAMLMILTVVSFRRSESATSTVPARGYCTRIDESRHRESSQLTGPQGARERTRQRRHHDEAGTRQQPLRQAAHRRPGHLAGGARGTAGPREGAHP